MDGGTWADGGTYGVPATGFPSWRERTILVLTNAVRIAPTDYKQSAIYAAPFTPSLATSTVLGGTYPAQPPIYSTEALHRSARQHSQEMADYNYFAHESVDGGSALVRIRSYYTASFTIGENIAAGTQGDPIRIMFQWLCDQPGTGQPCCADGASCDGHRRNIMNGAYHALGTGYGYNAGSTYRHYWTQDFGGVASPPFPPLVDGTHLLAGTTETRFLANYYAAAPAQSVMLVLEGMAVPLAVELGTAAKGTWSVARPRAASCRGYHYVAVDANGLSWRYPAQGELATAGEGGCTVDFTP